MSIERFFTTDVTIVTGGTVTDRYDDEVADWDNPVAEVDTKGWLTQVSTSESIGNRDVIVTGWKLYVPASVTVNAGNRIVGNGLTFEVDGDPHYAQTPAGLHHVELALREVEDE